MSADSNSFCSSAEFFEAKYRKSPDPWNFSGDAYELGRYQAIISTIAHRRYRSAFEPGCSIGVLTERLAAYCESVLAADFSPTAAWQAAARCAHLENVEVIVDSVADRQPGTNFDLLVLSEIGYYFGSEDWRRISAALVKDMPKGGTVVAAHWLGHSADHRLSGDEVHAILRSHPLLSLEYEERNSAMRLDRLVRL